MRPPVSRAMQPHVTPGGVLRASLRTHWHGTGWIAAALEFAGCVGVCAPLLLQKSNALVLYE